MKKIKIHPLIIGTAILTLTGFISRIIGFFYRIYLSRIFGEEGMGIYQLVNPVLSLSFSLTAAGYQTAISKFVAERAAVEKRPSLRPMFMGIMISTPLSVLCGLVIYALSDFIAVRLLLEARTASMLRILAFSIPLSSIHACINGYFYGCKKAGVPAATQLIEQIARVACVYAMSAYAFSEGQIPSINVAVYGLAIGEFVSLLAAILPAYLYYAGNIYNRKTSAFPPIEKNIGYMQNILYMALPLTANRLVLNILQSIESVSIPARLKLYGYDNSTALSVYGVLTGMAMPFIFFPNALTNSISVLLLPMISENYALGDMKAVKKATFRTIRYCFILGFFFLSVFALLGNWAGTTLFNSPLAGYLIRTLSFLCPFLYLDTTLSSILQGLGMAGRIFVMNLLALSLRLCFVFFAIPRLGISGYLYGILFSQIMQGILYLLCLYLFFHKQDSVKRAGMH
ncbi:MAG: polysaccharide biosynthesis protein [Bacteroidales bacterium]|nr:polysaccharide biosynthesis protein [Lachnoclostridium sp.]MCM1384055.1 polysaccharide biosynthesis protein [Lachnoclostridium sp.]MCM1465445.1 polysaccharide biosynthesis protein [Bacteroidales bacterium]